MGMREIHTEFGGKDNREETDWIDLDQDKERCRALVKRVINVGVYARTFLSR
jgi:hypothetical protein